MVMKKLLFIFISSYLFANVSNNILLIEAKLYPKMLYLLNDFNKKDKIKIAIIVDKNSYTIGKKLKSLINDKRFKIDLVDNISLKYDVYIFATSISKEKALELAKSKKVIFSIFPDNVESAMFSVTISQKVYPLVNPKFLKISNIKFDPIILKVGKIYEK